MPIKYLPEGEPQKNLSGKDRVIILSDDIIRRVDRINASIYLYQIFRGNLCLGDLFDLAVTHPRTRVAATLALELVKSLETRNARNTDGHWDPPFTVPEDIKE